MDTRTLGQELRRLREWREWTLTEVAHRVGISKALLTLAEQGKRRLPLDVLRRLLALYDSSLALVASTACQTARIARGGQSWTGTNLLALVTDRSLRDSALRLLRPVLSREDPEWLELSLHAGAQLPPQGFWSFPVPSDGVAVEGHVLIEMPGDELFVRCGESFSLAADQPHRYRNYLNTPIRAVVVLPRAVL